MNDHRVKKLYYRIGTVSRFLRESQSCIRYWLKHFDIKTKQGKHNSKGNDRLFTREDIWLLKRVQSLIRDEGLRLWAVRQRLAISQRIEPSPIFDPSEEQELRKIMLPDG